MSPTTCSTPSRDALTAMRAEFREARERVLKDAEGFEEIIHAVERLGILLTGTVEALGYYRNCITELAELSPLAKEIPGQHRGSHIPFPKLYRLISEGRNDAVHQGAYARHLTEHLVQLSLILEDALMIKQRALSEDALVLADFMVRSVACAQPWEPVSFVRQRMLTNSFSYLPLYMDKHWYLVSDLEVARFLQFPSEGLSAKEAGNERKRRLAMTVADACKTGLAATTADDRTRQTHAPISQVLSQLDGMPLLVVDPAHPDSIEGILMAFDLL